jgi:hypothetical protein
VDSSLVNSRLIGRLDRLALEPNSVLSLLAPDMNYDRGNEMFSLAVELVNRSSRNIFLTGKAGTGKTTFLKYIRENSFKQVAVVAPTGVAAINAGGVTIHSFFQLPISVFIPDVVGFSESDETVNKHSLISRLRMNREKIKVLQQLELLVIDEISMVRCDTLDAIDTVLRHIRGRPNDVFGGVQVLLIGDMFQLPPVIRDHEWQLLSEFYASPYFFDSQVLKGVPPLHIEFEKIYRQSDERFIRLLNQVRNNELDEEGMEILESRFQPGSSMKADDGFIVLTTHNELARQINQNKLKDLPGNIYSYQADIEDDFPPNAHPADEVLQLKLGAQVMFIRNDNDRNRRYYNGRIGTVTQLEGDKIMVRCDDDPDEIEVKKDKWENIRYSLNRSNRQLEQKTLGAFSQYPLRLAWAVTIHKSQGLTFEKAVIDAGKSFASGQVYVALSRCTSLEGLILHSRVGPNNLKTDSRILEFSRSKASTQLLFEELEEASESYKQEILLSSFDFIRAIESITELLDYVQEHEASFDLKTEKPLTVTWVGDLLANLVEQQEVAKKFQAQLKQIFSTKEVTILNSRVVAGAIHFHVKTNEILRALTTSPAITDSRIHAQEYNEQIKDVFAEIAFKNFLFDGWKTGFNIDGYHERKRSFRLPPFTLNAYASANNRSYQDIPNPSLHRDLRLLRDSICDKKDIPLYLVAGTESLIEMATYLPQTPLELEKVKGFGKARVKQYGDQFLKVIREYCEQHQIPSRIDEIQYRKSKTTPKERVDARSNEMNTKEVSFNYFKQGMNIQEISAQRKLKPQTIESHLAYFLENGSINIDEILTLEKRQIIRPILEAHPNETLTNIYNKIGGGASFGEIKLVLAWQKFTGNSANSGDDT